MILSMQTNITDPQGRNIISLLGTNARGQSTKVSRGIMQTTFDYDVAKGFLTSMSTPNVSSYTFGYDATNNLSSRKDLITNQEYQFGYDTKDRLTDWNIFQNGVQTQSNSQVYDDAGNIQSRTDLGSLTMSYGVSGKPHALASISGTPSLIPTDSLTVTYTDFRKIATLREGNKAYELTYGVDNQRRKSIFKVNGTTKLTRYYLGDYEEEITPDGNVRKIHYLSGGAILIRNNNADTLLYAYGDNQGSLTALANEAGTVLERYAYDPWGRRLNPTDWRNADTRTAWRTNRGYTGHEHLDAFGIINMNGRIYDPATAMFLSPDPFVQEPGNWVNYNRYGYCFNNPTNATDPSGYTSANDEPDYTGANWYNTFMEASIKGFTGGASAFATAYYDNPEAAKSWANANAEGYYGSYDNFKKHFNPNTGFVTVYRWVPGEYKKTYETQNYNGYEVNVPVIEVGAKIIEEREVMYDSQYKDGSASKELFEVLESVVVALRSSIHGSELFIHEIADARTYYTTISGGTKYIGKARLLGYAEVLGKYTFGVGVVVNVVGIAVGEQSWGKAALNIGVEALPFIIGTGPGMVIGLIYFTVDKTVGWDKVMTPTPNHPGTFIDENGNMEIR